MNKTSARHSVISPPTKGKHEMDCNKLINSLDKSKITVEKNVIENKLFFTLLVVLYGMACFTITQIIPILFY